MKLVAEPGGAVALAAALDPSRELPDTVIAVVTGGNVDPVMYHRALDTLG